MPLNSDIKFQKTLALAASASNSNEADAAELAARRLMEKYSINPLTIPDVSLYSRDNFSNNQLLAKLRAEARASTVVTEKKIKKKQNVIIEVFDHISFGTDTYEKPINHIHKRHKEQQPIKPNKQRNGNYFWTEKEKKTAAKFYLENKGTPKLAPRLAKLLRIPKRVANTRIVNLQRDEQKGIDLRIKHKL